MIPSKKLTWVNKILEVAFMKDKIVRLFVKLVELTQYF